MGHHEWIEWLERWIDWGIEHFAEPSNIGDVALSCCAFFVMMCAICGFVEALNPKAQNPITHWNDARWKQIRAEIWDSVSAVVASTSYSLAWFKWVYPSVHGRKADVFPGSLVAAVGEGILWLICFEVVVYFNHRLLHMQKPINFYKLHLLHHLYTNPTSFAAQAIHAFEAVMFAQASLVVTLLWPISVFTQYSFGIALLIWSIFAHDSEAKLDLTFHIEHHHHYNFNFGFLGIMDVVCGTVYYGKTYNGATKLPYEPRMRWFESIFPVLKRSQNVEVKSN